MSKTLNIVISVCLASIFSSCNKKELGQNGQNEIKVCINKIVDHEALDETARGIKETLQASGRPFKIVIESSQGNTIMALQLTDKFASNKADVIVGIGTIAAQSFKKYATDGHTYLVFSSVTDPFAAKLTGKPQISGVSNFIEIGPQIDLFLAIQPQLKRLGVLYNPGEINSIKLAEKIKIELEKRGVALVLQTASKTSEVTQAMENLVQNVDAIFISNDNTALSAFKCIVNIAMKHGIPVYVSDTDIVYKGAVAALGPNQYKIGVQTADVILTQLKVGKFEAKVEYPKQEDMLLVVNQEAANKCGIVLPPEILKRAQKILPAHN